MMRGPRFVIFVLLALLAFSAAVGGAADVAQITVSQAELDAAVARQHDQRTADRDRVKALLHRDDVRALAEDHGLDLRRAEAAVDTLEDSELQDLAQRAAQIESGLRGGDLYIRMSLIALLLIIIIVILLANS
jgi:hypothetical protein